MSLDRFEFFGQLDRQLLGGRITSEAREGLQRRCIRWQLVRLLVGDHLHPVLEAAQIAIGVI